MKGLILDEVLSSSSKFSPVSHWNLDLLGSMNAEMSIEHKIIKWFKRACVFLVWSIRIVKKSFFWWGKSIYRWFWAQPLDFIFIRTSELRLHHVAQPFEEETMWKLHPLDLRWSTHKMPHHCIVWRRNIALESTH